MVADNQRGRHEGKKLIAAKADRSERKSPAGGTCNDRKMETREVG
jgi:hypothetical protein